MANSEMKKTVQLWHGFRNGDLTFLCDRARRKDSTRLNHLAHIETLEDANKHDVRERDFQPLEEYAYIQFFCVHRFREDHNMLLYSLYHNTEVVGGLVHDTGFRCKGWADVEALRHLCAKVTGKGHQIYFVDNPEKMAERIRKSV